MRLAFALPRRTRIPLTSLVDVIFILLFFFMLAAHDLDWRALRVDLAPPPAEQVQADAAASDALTVVMLASGELLLEGHAASRDEVLAQIASGPRERPVVLVPGRGVNVQAMVSLLDAITPIGVPVQLGRPAPAP